LRTEQPPQGCQIFVGIKDGASVNPFTTGWQYSRET